MLARAQTMFSTMSVGTALGIGACVAAIALAFLLDTDAAATWFGPGWVIVPALAILLLLLPGTRASRIAALGLGVAVLAACGWFAVNGFRTGTPGEAFGSLTVCALVATGTTTWSLTRSSARTRPSGLARLSERSAGPLAVIVAGASLLTGIGVLFGPVWKYQTEVSNTAPRAEIAHIPGVPASSLWTAQTTDSGSSIGPREDQVVAAGAGFVTIADYPQAPSQRVLAVDGATGEVRWQYALDGAHPRSIAASADGAHVIVSFAPGGTQVSPVHRLVVLDAMTGERTADLIASRYVDADLMSVTATKLVLPMAELGTGSDSTALVGIDLTSGEIRWEALPPQGCTWVSQRAAAINDASVQAVSCSDSARVITVADEDGTFRWQHTVEAPQNTAAIGLLTAGADDSVITSRLELAGQPAQVAVLSAASGHVVLELPSSAYPRDTGALLAVPSTDGESMSILGPDSAATIAYPNTLCGDDYVAATSTYEAIIGTCTDLDGTSAVVAVPLDGSLAAVVATDSAPSLLLAIPGGLLVASGEPDGTRYEVFG